MKDGKSFFSSKAPVLILVSITATIATYSTIDGVTLWKAILGSLIITAALYLFLTAFQTITTCIALVLSGGGFYTKNLKERLTNHPFAKKIFNHRLFTKTKSIYPFISCGAITVVCIALFLHSILLILSNNYNWVAILFLLSPLVLFELINEYRAKYIEIDNFFLKHFSWLKPVKPMAGRLLMFALELSLLSLAFWILSKLIVAIPIQFYLLLILAVLVKR